MPSVTYCSANNDVIMTRHYLMEKTLLPLLMSLIMASCGGSVKEISYDALPEKARQFSGYTFKIWNAYA